MNVGRRQNAFMDVSFLGGKNSTGMYFMSFMIMFLMRFGFDW